MRNTRKICSRPFRDRKGDEEYYLIDRPELKKRMVKSSGKSPLVMDGQSRRSINSSTPCREDHYSLSTPIDRRSTSSHVYCASRMRAN
jgi:hypothetical protein